jgi:hypothetical protein
MKQGMKKEIKKRKWENKDEMESKTKKYRRKQS